MNTKPNKRQSQTNNKIHNEFSLVHGRTKQHRFDPQRRNLRQKETRNWIDTTTRTNSLQIFSKLSQWSRLVGPRKGKPKKGETGKNKRLVSGHRRQNSKHLPEIKILVSTKQQQQDWNEFESSLHSVDNGSNISRNRWPRMIRKMLIEYLDYYCSIRIHFRENFSGKGKTRICKVERLSRLLKTILANLPVLYFDLGFQDQSIYIYRQVWRSDFMDFRERVT